jgi:hypothetical protein
MTLLETVYYSQSARFVDPLQPDHVCLINKSLRVEVGTLDVVKPVHHISHIPEVY